MARTSEARYTRQVILLTGAALLGAIIWAAVAEIDQVSRAAGQVIPSGRVQVVQSTDGGVIEALNVKEGDHVVKGQVLVRLDSVKIRAAVGEGRAKVASLKTIKARIEAELFDKPLKFPSDVHDFPDFMANQQQLYTKRRAAITQDLAGFWASSYQAVRRELRGRYPKHPWPEDPTQAQATALTKARLEQSHSPKP